nr:probable glucan 1,3-alpha-glucosidase [Ipomoea batatas]
MEQIHGDLSRVLTNRLFTSFNRGSRSRSVEISSSRVLVDPMFPVFDRSSRSRSMESTSTMLLINDVSELFGDPERHQQSGRECAAVMRTRAECAEIINLVFDRLNDMAVLLHVSKTGKAKAKEGDDVNVKVKGKERTILISSGLLLCFTTHTCASEIHSLKFQVLVKKCSWPSLFSLPEKVTCGWLDILATISGITGTINGKTTTSYLIKSIIVSAVRIQKAQSLLIQPKLFCCQVVYHVDSKFDEHDILYDVLRLDAEHTDFTWEDVLQFSVYLIVQSSHFHLS